MKKLEYENSLVVRANQLIEAKYRLTATEQKIIYMLTTMVNRNDEDFKPYNVKISDLMELIDTENQNKYAQVKAVSRNMMKKVFTIFDTIEDEEIQVAWFSSVNYKHKKGIVEFEFSPYLKPLLLQLKACFTRFNLSNVMQLRSGYSLRLYELLKQYEKIGKREFQLSELRDLIGIRNVYSMYGHFRERVILVAQKEINAKTDISFDFEEIKEVRKVVALRFIIKTNKNQKTAPLPKSNSKTSPEGLTDFDTEYFKKGKIIPTELAQDSLKSVKDILTGRLKVDSSEGD